MKYNDYDPSEITPPAFDPNGPSLDEGMTSFAWQRPSTETYNDLLKKRKSQPDFQPQGEQQADTPPAIDRNTDIERKKFESFVMGGDSEYANRGQKESAAFWRNIWENPATNNPATQGAVNATGEGFEASAQVTHAGTSTIGAAAEELGRGDAEKRLKQMAEGTFDYGLNKQEGSRMAALPAGKNKPSVIEQYFNAKKNVEQSDEFRARAKAIADATGQSVDDWRVIMNAASDTSSANPSVVQTVADLALDPTNLAFAGPGTALKGAKAAGRALDTAAGRVASGAERAIGEVNPFAGALNREAVPVTAGRKAPKGGFSDKSAETLQKIHNGENVDPKDLKAMWDESERLAAENAAQKAEGMTADSATTAKIPEPKPSAEGDSEVAALMRRQNADAESAGRPPRWTEADIQDAADRGVVGQLNAGQVAEAQTPVPNTAGEDFQLEKLAGFLEKNPQAVKAAQTMLEGGNNPRDVLKVLQEQGSLMKSVTPEMTPADAKMKAVVENMTRKGRKAEIRQSAGGFDVVSQGGSKISTVPTEEEARALAGEVNRRIEARASEIATQEPGAAGNETLGAARGIAPGEASGGVRGGVQPSTRAQLTGAARLTPVERQIVSDLRAGKSARQIANETGMSEASVNQIGRRGAKIASPLGSRIAEQAAAKTGAPLTDVEKVIAEAEAQASIPSVDQTTIFNPEQTPGGRFSKVGENIPSGGGEIPPKGPKVATNDVPGWQNPNPVGDVQQAMIDAGVKQAGTFDPMKAVGGIGDWVLRGPKELLATGDISASLRQGIIGFGLHNNEWRAAMADQVKALMSPEGLQSVIESTQKLPSYDFGLSMGLASRFGDLPANYVGKGAAARYEAFTGAISRDIPVLGGLVGASDRAYEAFLGSLRARIFDTYAKSWGLLDVEALSKLSPAAQAAKRREAGQLADFINSITGHGHLGYLESMAPALNKMFFAPRFFASRLNTIASPFVYTGRAAMGQGSWKVAALAWRDTMGFAAETVGMMQLAHWAGADVDMNPTSSTFGQITVGDHHIDLTGGFTRTFGVAYQVLAPGAIGGGKHTTATGRTYSIRGKQESPQDMSMNDIVLRFLFQKANAPVTLASEVFSGVNPVGQEMTPADYIQAPLGLRNIVEAAANDLHKEGMGGALRGAGIGALELLGGNVQTYEVKRGSKKSAWD